MRQYTQFAGQARMKKKTFLRGAQIALIGSIVFRIVARLALLVLLLMAVVSTACLGCAPVKANRCCGRPDHCQKITKSCDTPQAALLTAAAPAAPQPSVLAAAPVSCLAALSLRPASPVFYRPHSPLRI